MKQKIFYLNDTKQNVHIFRDGLGEGCFVKTLQPAEGMVVEVNIPEKCAVFIKNWGTYVMISHSIPFFSTDDDSGLLPAS